MENRYGTTVAIRSSQHLWTLAPNTPELGPVNNQPWMAEVFMEYSLYCCSTSYRYILREWKALPSVVHLFLSSPGFRVKLQIHDIVYEKESIFFIFFILLSYNTSRAQLLLPLVLPPHPTTPLAQIQCSSFSLQMKPGIQVISTELGIT